MLTGRAAEQQRIDELLRQAVAGSSAVLVLRGDPGIGKTALVDYAASRAGSMRLLRATGIEAESELGFAGLYSLLHSLADCLTELPERQASALRAALGLGGTQTAAPDRLAVAAGTHGLLTTAAEDGPLLILVDRLDARPWAERARAELRASGETLASGGDGGEQLTPQELQIALLVSEGRTNAEVGRAVFLSTRTVEFHLSRTYRKLGVSSRTELTRRLASAGTVPG